MLGLAVNGWAQDFRDNNELIKHLEQQSGLLTVRLVPKAKTIQVFVVGYEKANLKFDDLGIEASIKIAGTERKLKVSRENDHFNIERTSKEQMKLNLKVNGLEKNNSLQFEVP